MKSIHDCSTLHNGVKMPWLGLGVFKAEEGQEVESAVTEALRVGYRSIDTAAIYQNEEGVGKAVANSGIPREEIFITTKVWNSDQGYEPTLRAFEDSRKKLGVEYIDLYLVHWPVKGKYVETWQGLEKLYKDGVVRAIGVSNFKIHHLQDIIYSFDVVPMVNQVEYHPWLTQLDLLDFCREHKIQMEAWSPLTKGKILGDPVVSGLAEKHEKTPAQILLRWDLEKEVVTIPKSVSPQRIQENAEIFDFQLSQEDIDLLDSLNKNYRLGPDPDKIDF